MEQKRKNKTLTAFCPSSFAIEYVIEQLKGYVWPGIDHILTKLILVQTGDKTSRIVVNRIINFTWNKEE
jgi:hypothetical protein